MTVVIGQILAEAMTSVIGMPYPADMAAKDDTTDPPPIAGDLQLARAWWRTYETTIRPSLILFQIVTAVSQRTRAPRARFKLQLRFAI